MTPTLRSYLPPPREWLRLYWRFFRSAGHAADGRKSRFAPHPKDRDFVWVQSLSDLTPRKLEGTDGASFPFWSFDGKFVGFFADGHLKKVAAAGGPVTDLAESPNPRGGSWNQDNIIVYEPDYRDSLWQVSASGGTPVRLTKFEESKHTTTAGRNSCLTENIFCSSPRIIPEARSRESISDRCRMVPTNT